MGRFAKPRPGRELRGGSIPPDRASLGTCHKRTGGTSAREGRAAGRHGNVGWLPASKQSKYGREAGKGCGRQQRRQGPAAKGLWLPIALKCTCGGRGRRSRLKSGSLCGVQVQVLPGTPYGPVSGIGNAADCKSVVITAFLVQVQGGPPYMRRDAGRLRHRS